jgi:hypothetical protein
LRLLSKQIFHKQNQDVIDLKDTDDDDEEEEEKEDK